MKANSIFIILFFLLSLACQAQKVRGKSNTIPFKGSAVQAEEKRKVDQRNLAMEEIRIAEEKRMEEEKKAEELKFEEERKAEELRKEEERKKEEGKSVLTLQSLGLTEEQLPKYYALIMGVAHYQNATNEMPNLDQPVKDSERLRQVLRERYTFHDERIKYIADPTRSEVIAALEHLSEVVTEKDNVLVFYAGHGVWDKQKDFGYWLASDANIKDKSTWIPNSTLKDYLGAIKSKHTLLIADACFSGSIFKTRGADASNAIMKFKELYKDKSRRAMTSGNLSTVPDKSVFAEFLLKKLEDNPDIFMSSRLLFSRMFEPISNNTHIVPQFGVIQEVGDEGGDFIFIKR